MPYTFKCTNCQARLSVREALAGQELLCPKCRHILTLPLPIPPEKDLRETSERTTGQSTVVHPRRSGNPASRLPYVVAIFLLAGVLVAENVWLLARSSGESKATAATERTAEKEPEKESTDTPTPAAGSISSVAPSPVIPIPPSSNPVAPSPVKKTSPDQQPKIQDGNAEWEKKSRSHLQEGLALLKLGSRVDQKKWEEADTTIAYAFADVPKTLTVQQQELMLEICERLVAIALVMENQKSAEQYGTLSERYRRRLGWNKEKFDEWKRPIFVDTCARMGITK